MGQESADRVCYAHRVPKSALIAGNDRATNQGAFFASELNSQVSMAIAYKAEMSAASSPAASALVVSDLQQLGRMVKESVQQLMQRGHTPSLVFIPQMRRFIKAMCGDSDERLAGAGTLGDYHLGAWDGLQLVMWPYTNSVSVVVADAEHFFQKTGDSIQSLTVDTEDQFREEHLRWLADADNEVDPSKIPGEHRLTVAAKACVLPSVGVSDGEAAVRVELDLTRLGYALVPGESSYHRPQCTRLQGRTPTYTLATRLRDEKERRDPCEECEPEAWEGEPIADSQGGVNKP